MKFVYQIERGERERDFETCIVILKIENGNGDGDNMWRFIFMPWFLGGDMSFLLGLLPF